MQTTDSCRKGPFANCGSYFENYPIDFSEMDEIVCELHETTEISQTFSR